MDENVLGAMISGIIGLITAIFIIFLERLIIKCYEKKNLRDKLLRIYNHLTLESKGNLFSICSLIKNIGEDFFFERLKIEVGILGLGLDAYHVELSCEGWIVILQKQQFEFTRPISISSTKVSIENKNRTNNHIKIIKDFKEFFKKKCIDSNILKEKHFEIE